MEDVSEGVLAAADFLITEVWTKGGLATCYVFFVIELNSRWVEIAVITPNPNGRFMAQVAGNLTDSETGFLLGKKVLLRDGDKNYSKQFDQLLSVAEIESKQLLARSPKLNAYAECFVLSLKSEGLNRMIFPGENSLRRAVSEFVEHYHHE